jgi:hypothetical protein
MADYQLQSPPPGLPGTGTILRRSDGAQIPTDPANLDYQTYLAWVADGNTPDPVPPNPTDTTFANDPWSF